MNWNELSMTDRSKYIMLAVHNGIADLNTIRHTYNSLSEGGPYSAGKMTNTLYDRGVKSDITDLGIIRNKPSNKYSGTSTPTQQMNRARVNYYDLITGENYGSTMPSGKVRVNSFSDLTPMAQDEYRRNHPTLLDEVIIYPKSGKGAKSTGMGSYYDDISTMTDANIAHTAKVREADSRVKETAAFEKPLNFLSPGQWFGAGVDYLQGESPFWKGIYDGNSGWLPDKFAEDNPRLSTLINMLGDGASSYVINGIRTNITNSPKYLKYTPNTLNRKIGVGTIGYEDLLKSNIVRGKEGAPIANAATMRKMQRAFERSGVSKATREKLNSQQVDKEAFNEIKGKMPKNSRYNPFEEVETFEEYLKDKEIRDLVFKDNIRLQNKRIIEGYDWLPNWGDNSLATFAYPDEFFNPKFKFSGDYAVQIRNASKYAKGATKLGHFLEHPTTEYPIELNNPDLSIYVKEKSLNPFRRKTRYIEIPKYKVYEDQLRIKNGETIKNIPSFRKIKFPTVFDPYIDYSISNESNK